jgi:hypothetical protein
MHGIILQVTRPEMSPELSWAIITLFSIIIVWVTIRYINRLDTMIDRIDTAIENIGNTLIAHGETLKSHEDKIKRLETKRRNP